MLPDSTTVCGLRSKKAENQVKNEITGWHQGFWVGVNLFGLDNLFGVENV